MPGPGFKPRLEGQHSHHCSTAAPLVLFVAVWHFYVVLLFSRCLCLQTLIVHNAIISCIRLVLSYVAQSLSMRKEKLTVKMFPCEVTILWIFHHVIHFPSLQFALDFVETHRIKECHVSACCKSGRPVHGTDSPLLSSYRRRPDSKQRPVGVWNVDGEVLRQASLSLRYAMSDFSHNLN